MAEKYKVAIIVPIVLILGFLVYKTATHNPVLTPVGQGSVDCELREIREAFRGK